MQEYKSKTIINLKKASSLLDKIISMTEENKYCIDIMRSEEHTSELQSR